MFPSDTQGEGDDEGEAYKIGLEATGDHLNNNEFDPVIYGETSHPSPHAVAPGSFLHLPGSLSQIQSPVCGLQHTHTHTHRLHFSYLILSLTKLKE